MLKGSPQEKPPLSFHPVEGIEAEPCPYIEWLLAGGKPIAEFHAVAWADTTVDWGER
jgi:hypothetical protein